MTVDPMQITLMRPDDAHLHVRDGESLTTVVPHSAAQFGRAIIMPNLRPPITTTAQALAYRQRILAAVPAGVDFQPCMALYLTDQTTVEEIERACAGGLSAAKLYPAGATTHADQGVTVIAKLYPVFEAMQEFGMPLLMHGEVTDPQVDIFEREAVFIQQVLTDLVTRFPKLKMVLEHITTRQAVDFIRQAPAHVAATITAHHLLYNRNALFQGGIRPHYYCLPILKAEQHRQALLAAATSGDPRFFLGTDSAPHGQGQKETAQGCAGCYTAYTALALYAEAFEQAGALDRLEGFASHFGADFYGWPRNDTTVTLIKQPVSIPTSFPFDGDQLVPLRAGEVIPWQML